MRKIKGNVTNKSLVNGDSLGHGYKRLLVVEQNRNYHGMVASKDSGKMRTRRFH